MDKKRCLWISALLVPIFSFQNCSSSDNLFGADSFKFKYITSTEHGEFSSELPQTPAESIKECEESLAPGESCYVAIQFAPTTKGSHSGSLQIISDNEVLGTVALTGQGE